VSSPSGAGGCRFAHRCPRRIGEICDTVTPPVIEPAPGHRIACHLPVETLAAMPPALGAA
jgi:peptide/nickel transport system ATP-binding protein